MYCQIYTNIQKLNGVGKIVCESWWGGKNNNCEI